MSTNPLSLEIVRPLVKLADAVCVSLASVLDIDMSLARVATPFRERLLSNVTAPPTFRLPVVAVLPLLESTVNFVVATVKVPPTFRVLCKEAP